MVKERVVVMPFDLLLTSSEAFCRKNTLLLLEFAVSGSRTFASS